MTTDPLEGMTQAKWGSLSQAQREKLRLPATPLMMAPFLGKHVEVVTHSGEMRRFWVGRSTGWAPCYLEKDRQDNVGGYACDQRGYISVKEIEAPKRKRRA